LLRLRLLTIGKDKDRWIAEGCEHYSKLLSRYAQVEIKLLPGLKSASSLSPDEIKNQEAERFEKALGNEYVVALSDTGISYDSHGFARLLEKLQIESRGTVALLVGGAWGLDERLLKRADLTLSLSPMTFSHQLVRLVLLEQLFRGMSIIHGTNYHK